MQAEGQKPGLISHQNYEENDSGQKNTLENYKLELTQNEASFIMKLLPSCYSLQFQTKIQKRSSVNSVSKVPRAPTQKKKSADSKLLNQDEQVEPQLNRLPSIRTKKSVAVKYNDQINDISYAKYALVYPPPEVNRRNTYDGLDESLKPCVKILNLLKNSKTSWPFREPVDPIAMGIPHYNEIVKQPMDLSKIQQNLRDGHYATPTQFHADLSKIIRNSQTFNKGNPQFLRVTKQFQDYYFKIIADPNVDQKPSNTYNDATRIQKQSTPMNYSAQNKKKKPERQYSSEVSISLQQKKDLSTNIRKLPREYMKGIVEIVRQEGENKIKDEFDLEDLRPQTIRELQNYVRAKLFQPKQKIEKGKTDDVRNDNEQSQFQIESEQDS